MTTADKCAHCGKSGRNQFGLCSDCACGICGLPAEPATWYCGACWNQVMRDREMIAAQLGVA